MLQSYFIYGFLAFSMWAFGRFAAKRERDCLYKGFNAAFWRLDVLSALLLFSIISGVRWRVGVDHLGYLRRYENLIVGYEWDSFRDVEIGFEIISRIFAYFEVHFTIYFFFWAFLQIFLVYYAVKNEKYLFPFIGLLVVMGPEYLTWMNGIRQMVAACIFVFSIRFLNNKNFVRYALTILIASTFHKSAIILLVLYFIPQKDYFPNRLVNIIILTASIILGLNPVWTGYFENIGQILEIIGYDRYAHNIDEMLESRRIMSFGPRRISIILLNLATIWYAPKLKQVYSKTNYLIYFNLAFIGAIFFNLFANTSHIFLRPTTYFTIFLVLTTSYLLHYLRTRTPTVLSLQFVVVFLISISYMAFSIFLDYGKGDMDYTTFRFFWDYYPANPF